MQARGAARRTSGEQMEDQILSGNVRHEPHTQRKIRSCDRARTTASSRFEVYRALSGLREERRVDRQWQSGLRLGCLEPSHRENGLEEPALEASSADEYMPEIRVIAVEPKLSNDNRVASNDSASCFVRLAFALATALRISFVYQSEDVGSQRDTFGIGSLHSDGFLGMILAQ